MTVVTLKARAKTQTAKVASLIQQVPGPPSRMQVPPVPHCACSVQGR